MKSGPLITTDVEIVAEVLNSGRIAGIPTETVYGLGARADLPDAVDKIFEVKGRPRHHPLIAHIGLEMRPERWAHLNSTAEILMETFWPGPLTLLLPKTKMIGVWVTGGRDTVALRMPRHPMTLELLNRVGEPIVAPSANRFGKVSPTTAQHVAHDLGTDVNCILDGGPCQFGLESTIVECHENSITLLRPGAITAAEISECLQLEVLFDQGDSRAPGMMVSHYAPNARVQLVETNDHAASIAETLKKTQTSCRILSYDELEEYAVNLYDFLRLCDHDNIEVVIAVLPSEHGIGSAIRDRLQKAAARI